ncbi:MAG: LytTR family DNA-binding domain-containing protein, partial [Fulvivirga sp.]|uniref:LytR/AlgR family response regulator transcription factor n=1 Tax=Fulvivirga sp. TaxID=1931237 RepID=UPI0032EF0A05
YVKVFCKDRMLITYQKLSHLQEVLPNSLFMRVHRSYIVNLSKISSYTSQDLDIVKTNIPIGGSYKDELLNALSKFQA